ncbi:hypothetical protein GCM10009807_08140 [Microbacterium lacus]|uniref:Glycosyl transferase family 1 domain-containing protein n=2 Tax=Microbacterium lacus TaxID=415217 RepID=A0ABN2G737_9MICO
MFLIEAMGRGVPMVVTNVGGMPGLADGTGLVVEVDDPDALAHAIVSILRSPTAMNEMRATALARYGREFSDETHERNLIAFYSLG